jgi:phospholipid/cholesterol/gamma-HCH transport system substrate-binding protein
MKLLLSHRSILVFLVIAAISVTYGAISYVNLPRLLGIGRYAVTVEVPDGSGLYPNSVVTLRGVQVGQVDGVRLTPAGAAVDIQIDNEAEIPTSSTAEIRSTSAVGEQYLNFEPKGSDRTLLAEGSVIPAAQVRTPVAVADLLQRVNTLIATVPRDQLRTTIDDTSAALSGAGGDLQRLLDGAMRLQREADANIDPTIQLIEDFQPVLRTQLNAAPDTRSFTRDLASFTDQLRMSDADIRGTLERFPPFLGELGSTIDGVRPTVPVLLGNLTSVGQVTRAYLPNVAQTVTILQPTLNVSIATLASSPVPESIKIDFDLVVNDPPPCTAGFQEDRRSPQDLSPARPGSENFCDVPPDSPQAVRGAHNYLCPPGSPEPGRSPTARGCGWNFQTPEDEARQREAAIQTQLDVATRQQGADNPLRPDNYPAVGSGGTGPESADAAAADPGTGLFGIATGGMHVFGNAVAPTATGWQGYLLNPLGVGTP